MTTDLVTQIRNYAHQHYYDPKVGKRFRYALELWSDQDFADVIEGAKTFKQAVKKLRSELYQNREVINESMP